MANVNKVELGLSRKIANPFKTTRKSTTNPFKFSDFEGNALDPTVFADVFGGKSNKLKLISTSVISSITKLYNRTTEPIAKFVRRVRTDVAKVWDYAKNTKEFANIKNIYEGFHNVMSYDVGKGISDSISGIGKNISEGISFLNKDIKEVGTDILSSCSSLIGKKRRVKATPTMEVVVLRDMLREELIADQAAKEIALRPANLLKEVA